MGSDSIDSSGGHLQNSPAGRGVVFYRVCVCRPRPQVFYEFKFQFIFGEFCYTGSGQKLTQFEFHYTATLFQITAGVQTEMHI